MKVLFVTTEMDDFVRVGGLAAVSAALPRALRRWSDVRVMLPGYRDIIEQFTHIEIVGECPSLAEMPACSLGRASAAGSMKRTISNRMLKRWTVCSPRLSVRFT